jgi:NAD(P)-dependent dehydrogenase (short-subunit alcohol dehydrogenase family)
MDLQLKGKEAIVTGGTAGIGLAIARVLIEEGAEVTIPGRDSKKLSEAVSSLPGSAHGIELDLATAEGAARLMAEVPETDILVACRRELVTADATGRVGILPVDRPGAG